MIALSEFRKKKQQTNATRTKPRTKQMLKNQMVRVCSALRSIDMFYKQYLVCELYIILQGSNNSAFVCLTNTITSGRVNNIKTTAITSWSWSWQRILRLELQQQLYIRQKLSCVQTFAGKYFCGRKFFQTKEFLAKLYLKRIFSYNSVFNCFLTSVWRGKPINFLVLEFSNHYCAIRHLEIYKMKLYNQHFIV